eukprot:3915393-Karenia_brevis.AAC.1
MNMRGLDINLAPGKTEAIISPNGEGSLKLKQKLAFTHNFLLDMPTGPPLRIVPLYKHLGGMISKDGNQGPELAYRKFEQAKASGALYKA